MGCNQQWVDWTVRKILITILCLVAVVSFAGITQFMQILARKNVVAGGGEILDEGFEGTYPGIWSETDASNLIGVTAAQAHTGSNSLYINGDGVNDGDTEHDWGSDENEGYGRFEVYIDADEPHNEQIFYWIRNSSDQAVLQFKLQARVNGLSVIGLVTDGTQFTTNTSFEAVWTCITWHYVDGVLDWDIEGAVMPQLTGGTDRDMRKIHFDVATADFAVYLDEVAFDTSDIACD